MRTTFDLAPRAASHPGSAPVELADKAPSWGLWLFELFAEWQERRRQRYHLQRLDDRLLQDIGLSRADVEREASKHFWMR